MIGQMSTTVPSSDDVVGVEVVDRERRVAEVEVDDVADPQRARVVGLVRGVLLVEAVGLEVLVADDPWVRRQVADVGRAERLLAEVEDDPVLAPADDRDDGAEVAFLKRGSIR